MVPRTPPPSTGGSRQGPLRGRPDRPVSARQRAVYRRRRLAVSGLGLVLIGILTLGVQGAQALISGLTGLDATPITQVQPHVAGADTPVALEINTAGISVLLHGEGLDADGKIDPPQGEVMWYTGHNRVSPGQLGTAVVAGHVSYYSEPDVFADLASVKEGDQVTISYGDDSTADFIIVSTRLLDKSELQQSELLWGPVGLAPPGHRHV